MSKITCDICGTTYAETASCCPICGNSRNAENSMGMEQLILDRDEHGNSARKKEIFDFDEVNGESYEDTQEYYAEDEAQETSGQNTFVIILLTVLIASMLIAAGFIFARFYLTGRSGDSTPPVVTLASSEPTVEETTELVIPCEELVLSSGASAQLSAQGQHFLLHVQAKPADTTEKILYTSGDESIATVTEDGRITAVSEGETIIFIACGTRTMECPVVIQYVEDTTPPEIDMTLPSQIIAEDVKQEQTQPQQTDAEEASPETAPASAQGVVLKLKQEDIKLGAYREYTLELDCDLKPEDVQWSSSNPGLLKVDEKGHLVSNGPGTTIITVKYGDQEVKCIVRCIAGL